MVKFNILYNSYRLPGGGPGYRWEVPKQNWAGDALIGWLPRHLFGQHGLGAVLAVKTADGDGSNIIQQTRPFLRNKSKWIHKQPGKLSAFFPIRNAENSNQFRT